MELIDKLRARGAQAQAEMTTKQTELQAQALEAAQLADQLAGLQKSVDVCADQLAMADSQLAAFENRVLTLRAALLTVWGGQAYNGLTVLDSNAYPSLAAAEAAVADFPRVREHLVAKLTEAEAALAKFERQHS